LSIGGGDEGGNGGNVILNVGPLLLPVGGEAFNLSMTDITLAIPLRSIPLAVIFVVPMVITPIVLVISLGRRLGSAVVGTGVVAFTVRELVPTNAGLLLGLRLGTAREFTLVEAGLETDCEGIWDLYRMARV
jgi:hypothetical protein